jgi:putative hydrolase of the HAD superfamily
MPIRGVILDYGNVFCLMPGPKDFAPLYELSGIQKSQFQESFWRHRLEYDRGSLDGFAYWQTIATEAIVTLDPAQIDKLIAADVALWQRIHPALVAWVQSLRGANLKTAILSNMPLDVSRYVRQNAQWMKLFDSTVFSAELGMLKPEPEIYATSLAGLKVRPAEALFIDDSAANVEGARAIGMHALQFESAGRLAKDIAPFRLPAVPAS